MPHLPRSPFSTPLSGSARETELRLRGIFLRNKKRPPVWLLALTLGICVLCGSLVSCQKSSSPPDDSVLENALYQAAVPGSFLETTIPYSPDDDSSFIARPLAVVPQDGYTLAAYSFSNHRGYLLAVGVLDNQSAELTAPVFVAGGEGSLPHVTTFQSDGDTHLLYTANSYRQGYSAGAAGVIRLDGPDFTWVWPVEGDLRSVDSQASQDYDTFWEHRKPLLCPGGVDLFQENTSFAAADGTPPQWTPESNELFYPAPEDELPIGVMYQSRVWLEEFTRERNNPLDAVNTSALWYIQSLTADDFQYPNQKDSESAYTLLARADTDDSLYFAVHILFDQETGSISTAYDYAVGSLEEVTEQVLNDQTREEAISRFQQRDSLILAHYQQLYPGQRVYWLGQEPSQPQEGDIRLDSVAYAGEALLYETTGVAFSIQKDVYGPGYWGRFVQPALIVLSQGQDGSFQSVLGEPNFSTDGMAIEDVIRQVNWSLLDLEVCLYRDGYPNPIGPGNWCDLFRPAYEGEPDLQILEGYTPIYYPGDHWERWSVEGFSALRYYQAAEDRYTLNTVDVTRDDLYTPRGIRVGATRAEVLAAYPEAVSGDYWGQYPGQDYLWYSKDSNDFGAAILFFFQGDTLSQITLRDMFD